MRIFLGTFFILAALIAGFLLFPRQAGTIAAVVLILGLGISIVSIVRRQARYRSEGRIDHGALARNCAVEILGVLITLGLSILLARGLIAMLLARVAGLPGLLLGMLCALLIGAAMSVLVQSTWGRLASRPAPG